MARRHTASLDILHCAAPCRYVPGHLNVRAQSQIRMTPQARPSELVAVILSPDTMPKVVEIAEADIEAQTVLLDGRKFTDTGGGDWIGFFDWLRNSNGQIIGVQQWVDEPSPLLFGQHYEGVEANPLHGVVQAYFGPGRDVDPTASCDQDFGNNRLLVSGASVALTFGTGAMK